MVSSSVDGDLRDAGPVTGQDIVGVVLTNVNGIVVTLLLEIYKQT